MNFEFETFKIFNCDLFPKKSKFKTCKIVNTAVFDLLKSVKIDFMQNQKGKRFAKFPLCGISTIKNPNYLVHVCKSWFYSVFISTVN